MIPGFKSVLVPDYSIPVPPPPQPPPIIILQQQRREARGRRLSISKRRRYRSAYSQSTVPASSSTPGGDSPPDVDMEAGPMYGPELPPTSVYSQVTQPPGPTPLSMLTTQRSLIETPISMRTTQRFSPGTPVPIDGHRFSPVNFNPYDFFRGGPQELADIYDQIDRYERRRRSRLRVVDETPPRAARQRPAIELVEESPMLERGYFQPPPVVRQRVMRRIFSARPTGPSIVRNAIEDFNG